MSFGLTPRQHLDCLIEERALFRRDVANVRLGINCCAWANHLPEIVFSAYEKTSPAKVYSLTNKDVYRAHLVTVAPNLELLRDLCDFAKHGPGLTRTSVQVSKTEEQKKWILSTAMVAAGAMHHEQANRLVVMLKDGSERWLNAIIEEAVDFWEKEFIMKSL